MGIPGWCHIWSWTLVPGCLPVSAVTLCPRLQFLSNATLAWSAGLGCVSSWQLIFSGQLVGMGLRGCAQSHKTPRLSLHGHHISSWCVWIAAALLIGQQSFFFFKGKFYSFFFLNFIYFWLRWVFVAACRFSLVAASGGLLVAVCGLLIAVASLVVEHGL